MKQEDRELLLKDLSARLPYGVKIELMPITKGKCVTLTPIILQDYFISDDVNYLPYLRPMSSMTEDEMEEYDDMRYADKDNDLSLHLLDWLNSHHFDFRGFIPLGLALEATPEIYPSKIKVFSA